MSSSIERIEGAARALALAETLDDIKHIHDIATAAAQYARAAKLGLDAQNSAAVIKLRAERKAGELLAGLERTRPQDARIASIAGHDSPYATTLAETDTSRQQANRWQKVAELPDDVFEEYVAQTVADGKELTTAGALKIVRGIRKAEPKEAPPLPPNKYRVIYADPPWQYEEHGATLDPSYGGTRWHYPSMSIDELCALPVKELAAPDSVLFIWVTSPKLDQVWPILSAWGFAYKTSFVWDKVRHNFGYYNSVRHELLLIAGRGSSTPDNTKLFDSVQTIERGNHSEKPEEFRQIIETLYPGAKKVELFARRPAEGWDSWGNELGEADEPSN